LRIASHRAAGGDGMRCCGVGWSRDKGVCEAGLGWDRMTFGICGEVSVLREVRMEGGR
jgi:hypothetical protein